MNAIQKLYPHAKVTYGYINRGGNDFPDGFAEELKKQVAHMGTLTLSKEEETFLKKKCYYFDPVFIDLLKGYRYDPNEVSIEQVGGGLKVTISGYWYRTVLWEVPLMALISELYFKMLGILPENTNKKAELKAKKLEELNADFSEFGTRRRFSFGVQDTVVGILKENAPRCMKGTSNVFLAMKYNITPIGTHPHEWFMYHAAHFGYKMANKVGLDAWADVYGGHLGIALTDTYTTEDFFRNFSVMHAKLFDGVRWDSGDPLEFTNKVLNFYKAKRIDATGKTIVYSDSLNLETVEKIKKHVGGRIHDVYGIGTYFSNDVGAKPLNMVIKLTTVQIESDKPYHPTVKLSDVAGKNTGTKEEISLCRQTLLL